ncbi:glycosyltransferase [Proteus terrae]|uniref:glycosyltransferase n=1 Tax=Proteus terrae TaxID=1574161 RepID=UPI0032DB600D
MNNILVIATAARTGGALSILKQVICDAKNTTDKYTFLIDHSIKNYLEKSPNIIYISIDTKNWIKRIYYDYRGYSKIIKKSNYNICLNLQNIPVRINNVKQYIYYHQPLPLNNHNFYKESKKLWLYQKFYLYFVKINIRFAHKFIVQTEWIQKNLTKKIKFNKNKIIIIKPIINVKKELINKNQYKKNDNVLFYPAASYFYKNHNLIIKALSTISTRFLKEHNYILYLTITEDEYLNTYKHTIPENIKEFIVFLGPIKHEDVHYYFSASKALLFPSYIETFGLPLVEAMSHGCFIIASDLEYSMDTLKKYSNKSLCASNSPEQWAKEIKKLVEKDKIEYEYEYINSSLESQKNIIEFIINDSKD